MTKLTHDTQSERTRNKDDLKELDVASDLDITPQERETTLTFPHDTETGRIYSDVPVIIRWVLAIEESEILSHRLKDDETIVGIKARIPKGIIKLQKDARKSNNQSQMVSKPTTERSAPTE
jgi:hypothetical protein